MAILAGIGYIENGDPETDDIMEDPNGDKGSLEYTEYGGVIKCDALLRFKDDGLSGRQAENGDVLDWLWKLFGSGWRKFQGPAIPDITAGLKKGRWEEAPEADSRSGTGNSVPC